MEYNRQSRRDSSGLFKAIVDSSSMSVKEALDNWLKEGNDLSRWEISFLMPELRKRRKYSEAEAFQVLEWLESHEKVEFGEKYYVQRVDLVAMAWSLQNAENYIKNKIPESFKREVFYQYLLANCVLNTNTKEKSRASLQPNQKPETLYIHFFLRSNSSFIQEN
ncbi:unnamed protein product [Lactuca virosa]|uniref:Uncharacterized protein n=1 Tax=Lactuca virosa TaxID=75947 RepID=A0AAU9P701_9ASTR|nr:unnamed protein product [Lactuca virosa]